jgi:chemotaxis protein methyltransferase CheR
LTAAPAIRIDDKASLVEGEYPFLQEDFERIASLMREQSGICLPGSKAVMVYSRLAKRLRALRLNSFAEYCTLIGSARGEAERSAMLAELTTNVTNFFREPHHFDHLRVRVLEPMAEAVRAGARMRLWSSACSSGEEAYSIALTVLSVLPDAANHDVRILATDIDPVVLRTAQAGLYGEQCVARIPASFRQHGLQRTPSGKWRVRDEVRALVAFKRLNLVGDWPMRGAFDAIFCRNVAIYFDEATQRRLWARLRDCITPRGRLYVGHSERVDLPGYASDGLTAYRLAEGADE